MQSVHRDASHAHECLTEEVRRKSRPRDHQPLVEGHLPARSPRFQFQSAVPVPAPAPAPVPVPVPAPAPVPVPVPAPVRGPLEYQLCCLVQLVMSNLLPVSSPHWLGARTITATAVLLLSASCGGSLPTPVAAPSPPTAAQSTWIASVVGATPDMSLFVRPNAARADTYWAPLIARALSNSDRPSDFISHGSGMMILNAQQIDLYVSIRDPLRFSSKNSKVDLSSVGWVGVIHGMAPIDPVALRNGSGVPLFAAGSRLPSGVMMYPPNDEYAREYEPYAPTLFVTGDGTCIVTEQVSAPRARDFFASNGTPPDVLEAAPDALAGVTSNVTSMRFLSAEKNDQAAVLQGAVAIGFGLRGGNEGAIDAYADYATSDDASRGYKGLQATCLEKTDSCLLDPGWFRDAKAVRDGQRIAMRLTFSEKLLRSLRDWTP